MGKHTKLAKTERILLGKWKDQGLSNIECGKRLGRDKSTIGRELKRNPVKVWTGKSREILYEPLHAQFVAEQRKQKAFNGKQPLKNKKIYGYVMDHLRQGWAPEQIAGRLKFVDHADDPSWWICHETIYAFIYKVKVDGIDTTNMILGGKPKLKEQVIVTDHEKPLFEYFLNT